MARSRGVWRFCLGWCLLLCVLPTVEAASKTVKIPSYSEQVSGSALLGNSNVIFSTAINGEFIPAASSNIPLRGLAVVSEFPVAGINAVAKKLLKGGLAGLATGYAMEKLLEGVGWVMDPTTHLPMKKERVPANTDIASGQYSYTDNSLGWYSTANAICQATAERWAASQKLTGPSGTAVLQTIANPSIYNCTRTAKDAIGQVQTSGNYPVYRYGNTCPSGSTLDNANGGCFTISSKLVPVAEQDYVTLDDIINRQNTDWYKDMLRQACEGALQPQNCYKTLALSGKTLLGPASVDGGKVTTTTTRANPDGTTSKLVSTQSTKYSMTYSPTTFNYNKGTTTTTSVDGKPTETTETTEDPPADVPGEDTPVEETPDDNQDPEITPSPCSGAACDGPAYIKLYEPIKETKETFIDSYISSVKQLPLLSAVGGFFKVSAAAGCPVWSAPVSFNVYAASFAYDLVFDFHCQGWFVAVASYAKYVMAIVCSFLAFRQAFLD